MSTSATNSLNQQQPRVRLGNASSPSLTSNSSRLQPIRAIVPYQLLRGSPHSPTRSPSCCSGIGNSNTAPTISHSPPCPIQLPSNPGGNGSVEPRLVAIQRLSPDSKNPSERGPVAVVCRVERSKPQSARGSNTIRRASSLDTVTGTYLTGQWPRELQVPYPTCMRDKATQTPGIWSEDGGEMSSIHQRSASWGSADHLREQIAKLRQQLLRSKPGGRQSREREQGPQTSQAQPKLLSASLSNITASKSFICRVPSYVEGINHELENVFINEDWVREDEKALEVQDGRRAPFPPHHQGNGITWSADTQAPCSCCSSPCSCPSPVCPLDSHNSSPCSTEDHDKDSGSSSPLSTFATSPKPNNSFMFKREPPEGCEKVKVFEEIVSRRSNGFPLFSCPDKNKVNFIPTGSAFCPVKLMCSSLFSSYTGPGLGSSAGSLSPRNVEQTPASFIETSDPCSAQQCLLPRSITTEGVDALRLSRK